MNKIRLTEEQLVEMIQQVILEKKKKKSKKKKKKKSTTLCSRGKNAAKAKYDVYPSAYANGWAVQYCSGKFKKKGKKK